MANRSAPQLAAAAVMTSLDFIAALSERDLPGVRACPKADLHTHESISRVHERMAPHIEWIPQLGLSRHCPLAALQEWMAPWLELGFHKVLDLSGDELAQPIDVFRPLYRAAKDAGMLLKAHVGEWGTADDVRRAVEGLELDEVQHRIAAADSPTVMCFLADNNIRLNICPTSNLLLGRVGRLQDHPIRRLFDAGVRVTINTDDAIVFGAGVSEEFLRLYEARLFTAEELDQIRRWSLEPTPTAETRTASGL